MGLRILPSARIFDFNMLVNLPPPQAESEQKKMVDQDSGFTSRVLGWVRKHPQMHKLLARRKDWNSAFCVDLIVFVLNIDKCKPLKLQLFISKHVITFCLLKQLSVGGANI